MGVPVAQAPFAYALLVLIPAASLYGLMLDRGFVASGLFDMRAVREERQWYRIITSAFLHGDLGHLLVNVLTFFLFAPFVEARFGTGGFALLFFGSQLGAMGFTYLRKRGDADYRALGASGAVSGVLFAYCVVAPFSLLFLFFAIPIPAILFAFGYLAYSTLAMGGTGRIGHEAHIGGAVTGALLAGVMVAA